MIRINLLPYRQYQSRLGFKRMLTVAAATMALLLTALVGYHLHLTGHIKQLTTESEHIRQQVTAYHQMNRQVTANQEKARILKQKMAIIGGLEQGRFRTVALLNDVSANLISERMWLTSLTSSATGVEISGVAMDEKTVADFLTRLEKSPLFATVGLKLLQRQTFNADTHLKAFAIGCNWQLEPSATDVRPDGGT